MGEIMEAQDQRDHHVYGVNVKLCLSLAVVKLINKLLFQDILCPCATTIQK